MKLPDVDVTLKLATIIAWIFAGTMLLDGLARLDHFDWISGVLFIASVLVTIIAIHTALALRTLRREVNRRVQ